MLSPLFKYLLSRGFSNFQFSALAVILSFVHSVAYLFIAIFNKEPTPVSMFTEGGMYNPRWLDPSIWLFWYIGFIVIFNLGLFETRGKCSFIALIGFVFYFISILWGVLYGIFEWFLFAGGAAGVILICIAINKFHKHR